MSSINNKTIEPQFSVSHFIQKILEQVIKANASDLHFEPTSTELKIRYRKDGFFVDMPSVPAVLTKKIFAHLKSIANLNVTENRKPQDGRITIKLKNQFFSFRISTVPVQLGESLVLRVLSPSALQFNLKELGLSVQLIESIRKIIKKPHGMFIVTGPTGSGKTTTLYSLLRDVYSPQKKYLTVEDPVEYIIPGVCQVSTNDAIGLSFSKILKAFLRHDPDMIMIGEIRDLETAQIAIQASLTGHLVLTTLHANSAAAAITRLIDLGINPSLIASSLRGVVSQRLIRTFCNFCKGVGCDACQKTGFLGRTAIFELMSISLALKQLIAQNASLPLLENQAEADGMVKLVHVGQELVEAKKISIHDLNKVF